MSIGDYLQFSFVQHALIAGALVAVICGLIGPFVITRRAAFAVHGTAELSFTGAAAGLVVADDAVAGALIGSIVVAAAIGLLAVRERERDSAIGVILAFGLGAGVWLLGKYHGFSNAATNILFGYIFGVSDDQIWLLLAVAEGVLIAMTLLYRPLLFASVDPDVAEARGVAVGWLAIAFLVILALAVAVTVQIVGTLLIFALLVTPGAAALQLTARPARSLALSIIFSLVFTWLGLALAYFTDRPAGFFITTLAFGAYLLIRGARILAR